MEKAFQISNIGNISKKDIDNMVNVVNKYFKI